MRFTQEDRKVLESYREFVSKVEKVLRAISEEIEHSFGFMHSEPLSGEGYLYLRYLSGDVEVSPGIKFSGEFIIRPVVWLSLAEVKDSVLNSLGYHRDKEFPGYYIKEKSLEEDFFEKPSEDQMSEIKGFFVEELTRLKLVGILNDFSPTLMG